MIHISQCERCSALLRDALEDLHREADADEQALAESIPAPEKIRRKSAPRWWPLAIAAALLVLVSGAAAYRLLTPGPQPQALTARLSRVYASHRSMDLRFAVEGDVYSPVRLERSGEEKRPYSQLALAIAEGLEKNPRNRQLLRDKGRLALFEGRLDEAISLLEPLPHSEDPEIQTDLAAAYFQRGLQRNVAEDRERAFVRFRDFAQRHPNDTAAVFNLAVTAASVRPADEAILYFEKYLALETSPQWKAEAAERLKALRERPQIQ
jgi:tetratricopeptide (TPR) repeat protein